MVWRTGRWCSMSGPSPKRHHRKTPQSPIGSTSCSLCHFSIFTIFYCLGENNALFDQFPVHHHQTTKWWLVISCTTHDELTEWQTPTCVYLFTLLEPLGTLRNCLQWKAAIFSVFQNSNAMSFTGCVFGYREPLKGSSQVLWNRVKKLRFIYLLQAGERNFFISFSLNLGPTF